MPAFVVLLKGVNVGKGNRIAMADFRALLTGLGFTGVQTLLNSGNAVFTAPGKSATALGKIIAKALVEKLELDVPVIVKTKAEWAAILAENPIAVPPEHHSRFLVACMQDNKSLADLVPLQDLAKAPEAMRVGKQAAYLFCPNGILDSKVANSLLGKGNKGVTSRNWATVLKLADLLNEPC